MLQRLESVGNNRYVVALMAGSLAGLVLLVFFLLVRGQRDTVVLRVQPIEDPAMVRVYVGGEVADPGLFSLDRGSRVADAISAAGGVLTGADTSGIGMAAVLNDADQIIVPPRRDPPAAHVAGANPAATAGREDGTSVATATGAVTPFATVVAGPININNALVSELERLPGIGPAISARIIEYRELNGPFQTLDELAEVSGISERMVDEMRPLITLGP